MPESRPLVLDASAAVETLLGTRTGRAVRERMRGSHLHAPAHLDAEILSALGRLHRAQELEATTVERALHELSAAPIARHRLPGLLAGAWSSREQLRLVDGLYVELARVLHCGLLTADSRLARASDLAELAAA